MLHLEAMRFRAAMVSIITVGVLAASAQAAEACTGDTWYGTGNASAATSGSWETASDWSAGVPGNSTVVCITVPGSYEVTLAPDRRGVW